MGPRAASGAAVVELGTVGRAVALERAALAHGIGALEDPVLPGGEPAEDARLHGLGTGEADVGLHAGERVGREGRALLQREAQLVLPVDAVRRDGREPELVRALGIE